MCLYVQNVIIRWKKVEKDNVIFFFFFILLCYNFDNEYYFNIDKNIYSVYCELESAESKEILSRKVGLR